MNTLILIVIVAVAVLALLPRRHDPIIRLIQRLTNGGSRNG